MNDEDYPNTGHRIFRVPSQQYSNEEDEFKVYNILLLGETGAGKSTTINAFANYMKYGDFEVAKANRFVQMIPSKFTLPDPESGEPILIHSEIEDENEQAASGTSSTKAPVAYTFRFKDRTLRIIDTPGMGDTNGVTVDRENFDQILNHLHNYKQLHGILVLIKSSETRKTAFFRYCITELLTYLHRSACHNLLFCFTFSRNSFYGPGEGFQTLKSFLRKELKNVPLTLEVGENCFFIDNEAYRFLVAQKNAYPFKMQQEMSYKESWDISVKQSNEMWERITNHIKPHDLTNTISLNNAQKLIFEIAEPMVLLQTMIQLNISQIETKKDLLKNSSEDIEELVKNLYLDVDDLKSEPLDYPRTVCIHSRCTDLFKAEGVYKVHYKTICHPHCYLDHVGVNTVGDPILKNCSAIEGRPSCTVCGCDWQKHMHIKTNYIKVKRSIIDTGKQQEINTKEDAVKIIEDAIRQMEVLIEDYQGELKVIKDVCTKFAVILVTNSNTPYNKFIDPYLDLLMNEENKKVNSVPGYSKSTYESLQRMKDTHRQSVKIMEDAINSNQQEQVQLRDIFKYMDTLFGLKQTGAQFRQIMETGSFAKKKIFESIPEKSLDLRNVTHNTTPKHNSRRDKDGFWGQFRFW